MAKLEKKEGRDWKVLKACQEDLESKDLKEKKVFLIQIWQKLEDLVQLDHKEKRVFLDKKDCQGCQDRKVQGVL